jgi:hypothetical protein
MVCESLLRECRGRCGSYMLGGRERKATAGPSTSLRFCRDDSVGWRTEAYLHSEYCPDSGAGTLP